MSNKMENLNKLKFYGEDFYFECQEGWYDLLFEAGERIESICDFYNIKNTFKATQVKEKFGSLRIYYEEENIPSFISKQVSKIIEDIEIRSINICEICGKEGNVEIIKKYSQVRCKNHSGKK